MNNPLTYRDALTIVGGLSSTEKMPWWGWSISANDCITGSKLAQHEGTVCSDCYALKGRYLFPNVLTAHNRRLEATKHTHFVDAFVLVLQNLHAKTRKRRADGRIENRFRWFDSGDLQSEEMLDMINRIAAGTPEIDHWLPTREIGIVSNYLSEGNSFSENLVVRISAPLVGAPLKTRVGELPTATVGVGDQPGVYDCQALASQGNRCLDCDRCWNVKSDINYPLH